MGPHPLQVQCEDGEEYKRTLKLQLKALLDGPGLRDSLNGLSEFVVLLVRAPGSDAAAKAPRKVSPSCQKGRGGKHIYMQLVQNIVGRRSMSADPTDLQPP